MVSSVSNAKALAVPLVAYGLMQQRRRRRHRVDLEELDELPRRQPVTALAEVEVLNDTASPILLQGYGAKDVVRLWPACREEVQPGQRVVVAVPAGPLGKDSLQLAVRFRYCAKLIRVRRGAKLRVVTAGRGHAVVIEERPRGAVSSLRDISHWSRVALPEAGGADPADVDGILGPRSARDRLQAWAALSLYLGTDRGNAEVAVPLAVCEPAHPQLPARLMPASALVTASGSSGSSGSSFGSCATALPLVVPPALQVPPGAVVIGTVRCGYGHHRIALALASYGMQGAPALLHDFAAVEGCAPPVELLTKLDALYSRLSRLASEDRTGILARAWNELLSSGDANASRSMRSFCERLKPLLLGLPPDTPVVAAHTFVAVTALLCGCRRVINLVFDNHAQPVHVVPPPAINCVQTPKCEQQLLEMGVPASHVRLVGHFLPKELVDNAIADTEIRMERARRGAPRRFLLSVGGAGAQQRFLTGLVRGLVQLARELPSGLSVVINAGDHEHMQHAVIDALRAEGARVSEYCGLSAAADYVASKRMEDRDGSHPAEDFVVFSGRDPLEATAVTDVLIRAADVLVTKPSELAFYPLPKLHISRVGNHEAQAAVRARELGDGTSEAATVAQALVHARTLAAQDACFLRMCTSVIDQAQAGAYDGARRSMELAYASAAPPKPKPKRKQRAASPPRGRGPRRGTLHRQLEKRNEFGTVES